MYYLFFTNGDFNKVAALVFHLLNKMMDIAS